MAAPHRTRWSSLAARALAGLCVIVTAVGCEWNGVNSLPLPGTEGRGGESKVIFVEIANVGTLVPNSPVLVDDVVVGSVSRIELDGWHARVEASIRPEAPVRAGARATVGQTSLLGSSHLALNSPDDVAPGAVLESGATIPLDETMTYPSTEQTLASLSVVVNGGGLGQLGDIVADINDAFDGRNDQVASLLVRLDTVMGALDRQRDSILATVEGLTRLSTTFAEQNEILTGALQTVPQALDVLLAERPAITTALDRLRVFSDTATHVVTDVQDDLVTDLQNLEPTLRALADVGPRLNAALAYATVYPYGQKVIDRAVHGDYINLHATVDLTVPRLQRELLLGTPWGDPSAAVQPAPGDPGHSGITDGSGR